MKFRHLFPTTLLWIFSSITASAVILSFEPVTEISIPISNDGVYLDFTDSSDASAYTVSTSFTSNWDINPFYGGAAVGTSNTFLPVLASTATNSAILNLAPTTTQVGPSSSFPSSYSGSTDHMGAGALEFESGTSGYIGFILNPGVDDYYGWMEITFNDDGTTGSIHQWAWETSGSEITVGAVPEPSNAALLFGLGVASFILTRRRDRTTA
ncbi:MAG: PEP-CTERM sorting domain-containing protein [Opitutaceae bacterium]